MLSQYNPIDIEHALRIAEPAPVFPPAQDQATWSEIRSAIGEERAARIVAQAQADAEAPIPALPATLYLDFIRTGERQRYETPLWRRRMMLRNFTLAECLEGQGRFLDPALDIAWAICEESSWAYPAHQRALTDMARPHIDLGAAMTALELAEFDALLGEAMDPAMGRRIRYEVDRRCITPYLTHHDHWWLYNTHIRSVNNWTAVCNAGVVGAALYLEPDKARLAEVVARAARSLDDYLSTFDPDGGSTEGPGYWTYGFGYYTILAHLVEHFTGGQVNFFAGEQIRKIAQFPLRTLLSPGVYVNFSDCDRHVMLVAAMLAYLARRLDLPDLMRLAREQPPSNREERTLAWGLRSLVWRPDAEPAGSFVPARHDWYNGMMWMIARYNPADPDALVLAAKGGHNQEMHNQNDVGNIIVHIKQESVIADVGRGRYTKAYFGPERYDHFVNSSLGHSVPVVNGQPQRPGHEAAAVLLDHCADEQIDLLRIEMKDVYPPEAGLASLQRSVALHREPPAGWVELVDEVQFATGPGEFESVLTTFGQAEIENGTVLLRGERGALRVLYDPQRVTPRVEVVQDVDLAEGPTDVRRVVFAIREPASSASVRLQIMPA